MALVQPTFHRAMEVEPGNPLPYAALARLDIAQRQFTRAGQTLVEAKKAFASQPEGYRMLAEFYVLTRNFEKALVEYGALLREHPKDLTVKKNYAQLLFLQRRVDEAAQLNDQNRPPVQMQ